MKSFKTKSECAKCEAMLKIVIKKINKNTICNNNFLSYDPPLAEEVKLSLKHLHSTASAERLRMLRVNEEVVYLTYFKFPNFMIVFLIQKNL